MQQRSRIIDNPLPGAKFPFEDGIYRDCCGRYIVRIFGKLYAHRFLLFLFLLKVFVMCIVYVLFYFWSLTSDYANARACCSGGQGAKVRSGTR